MPGNENNVQEIIRVGARNNASQYNGCPIRRDRDLIACDDQEHENIRPG
jgi:hypothetical protein